MKKVLFVATVTNHILAFHIPYLKMFKDEGFEVHVASNGNKEIPYCDKHFNIKFSRSPFSRDNVVAYKEIKKIMDEEKYDIIQCNTPVGGVLARLAAKNAKKQKARVIYIAHGFHFFKGAPIKNWLIYYPIEKYLSKYTDDLITINEEDYEISKKKFKAKNTYRIHGIGVDNERFNKLLSFDEKLSLRNDLKLDKDDFTIFFAGELNKNKNQIMLIEAMKDLVKENHHYKLILAGEGNKREFYEAKIKEYELSKNVFLLGYRNDVPNLLKAADLYVSVSKREGLPLNLVEAKISGLPVIATYNRGHKEIIEDSKDGFLINIGDIETLKNKIRTLYNDEDLRNKFIENSKNNIEKFYLSSVEKELRKIYLK